MKVTEPKLATLAERERARADHYQARYEHLANSHKEMHIHMQEIGESVCEFCEACERTGERIQRVETPKQASS